MSLTVTDDYVGFCEALRELCGLDLSQYKRPQMERRLRAYFARDGVDLLTDALPALRADPRVLDRLLDRVTINVSQLWRNPEQWKLLQGEVLPDLGTDAQVRAWSAGCSYGAEAFTLAAVSRAACPAARISILGTDIDRRMVARARAATFSEDDARTAPRDALERGFQPVGAEWVARRELRALCRFQVGDLLRSEPRAASFDLILCRNTVIYFSEPIRDELHARLSRALRPGGYLVIGSTERVSRPAALGLQAAHPFMYRKL